MDSLIGKTVDNYRILEVIGRGGMGVVFKALDTSLEKIVALKMIDPFLARDENFVRRFKTEAKALAKLENVNIVGVYALRETESGFFMVMEYVESKPISQALQENGPFDLKDTVSITRQLLNAIGHAHRVGVIHRDIKPSNILLCYDGKIKVTDFGLAKVVQQKGPASTVTQARAGTLYYMSPEQVKGLKNVDIRSDLYSLGMSVYEMIAGRVPFDKTDSDFTIQKKIVDGEIPPPVKFNPSIPKKFTKIISKSIDKDPVKRYQTAEEMLSDLEDFEKEISEGKISPVQKIKKSAAKTVKSGGLKFNFTNPVFLIASVSIVVILVALFFILKPGSETVNEVVFSITTDPPGAAVTINENQIGISPVLDYKLETPGDLNLRISKDGYVPVDTILSPESGGNENLVFTLQQLSKERVKIITNPSGARLIINNNFAGISVLDNYRMLQGIHQIRIEKPGYLNVDTVFKVDKNLSKNFSFVLSRDPSVRGFGILKVNSRPAGASVLLNGDIMGTTPFENKELPVGGYQVVIRQNGFEDYTEDINITRNKTKNISKTLTEQVNNFGRLIVNSKPSEAAVYMNGEFLGSTPYENEKIPVGSHRLVIKKTGYSDYSSSVRVDINKLSSISADLTMAARMRISSDPSGAEVLINDKSVGNTPYNSQIVLGEYTITITKPGYKPYVEKVNISDSKTVISRNQKLEPVTGSVEILVRPYGSIFIDDVLKAQDITSRFKVDLPGGKHRLKIVHPTLGSTSKEILITGETVQKYNFDLSRELRLNVVSNPSYCEIFINGQTTGKYTPAQLRLKVGSYNMMVKKDGYTPSKEVKYDVPSNIYEAADETEDKIEFSLSKIQ